MENIKTYIIIGLGGLLVAATIGYTTWKGINMNQSPIMELTCREPIDTDTIGDAKKIQELCRIEHSLNQSGHDALSEQQKVLHERNNEIEDWFPNIDQSPVIEEHIEDSNREIFLGEFNLSRYYRPLENQVAYHWGSYEHEILVNCGGASCKNTANGYELKAGDEGKVFACPPDIALGSTLKVVYPYGYELIGTCADRGGKIKGKRLDIWSGIGEEGYANIFLKDPTPTPAGKAKIYLLS